MTKFMQAAALVLVAVVLILALKRQGNDFSILISIVVCVTVGAVAFGFLQPIIALCDRLQQIGDIDPDLLRILVKVIGIAFTGEIAGNICSDSGNTALSKALQLLATVVILYLSVPMFTALLDVVEEILSKV